MARRIVIYTRFSTDMQRSESCDDQEREVRQALLRTGINASDAIVLKDRAESGTKLDRDEFARLIRMIQAGEVAILAVDDQSRLSRADNAASFITDLVYADGRFISTGENIDTDQEGWHLRVKIMEVHNSYAIRELGRRVYRGQKGRVLEDGSAGDYPYGYDSYPMDPSAAAIGSRGPKPKKGLRVCEAEARWVRTVFGWFVDGMPIAAIARELTRASAPKGNRASTSAWHHAQVRRMLCNAKYVGVWEWGRTKVVRNSQGKKKAVPVRLDERIVRHRQDLRIVDQATWERAQGRLRDLHDAFGAKQDQKRRGPRVHHTAIYPTSLLGGLVHCRECGSRMHVQGTASRAYLLCPGHRKGACGTAGQVRIPAAEHALLEFVCSLIKGWPPWLTEASAAVRTAIAESAAKSPETLRALEDRLREREQLVETLIDQLMSLKPEGLPDSPSLRRRLTECESDITDLRTRIAEARQVRAAAVTMPDDHWIRANLEELGSHLRDEPGRTALLVRRLFKRVTAESVVAPGKKRGFIRLRVVLKARAVLKEALAGRIPSALLDCASESVGAPAEFVLDLGGPTRRDEVTPEVVRMRADGKTWEEIGRVTGLGTGNAYNVWKRWSGARGSVDARATV
jgi:DNA invertase Pin-like site-specific DNA recombinase